MIRLSASFLVTVFLLAGGSAFSQSSPQGEGYDFDTLAACSVVYGRIAEIYTERGDGDQAASFKSTSYAYSASAYHMLQYQGYDEEGAFNYSEDRMARIVESLNSSSQSNPEGEMGVIEDWLPYCDTLGDGINRILAIREQDGW